MRSRAWDWVFIRKPGPRKKGTKGTYYTTVWSFSCSCDQYLIGLAGCHHSSFSRRCPLCVRRNCRRTDRQLMTSHAGLTQKRDSLGRPQADSDHPKHTHGTVRALARPLHQLGPSTLEQRGVQRAAIGTRVYAVLYCTFFFFFFFFFIYKYCAICVCGRVSKQSHDRPSQNVFPGIV
jgi:hypothetical protein